MKSQSMGRYIPYTFIKNLITHIDIVELIHSNLPLKKIGKNYRSCCPFHNDQHPSFTVSREKQLFYCFGCGKHGNVIDFIMNWENLNFVESIEELATIYGFKIPYESSNLSILTIQRREYLFNILKIICDLYQKYLWDKTINALQAREYLANRGINYKIIKEFALGFAPGSGSTLKEYFDHYYPQDHKLLKEIGILGFYQKEINDFFRNRIMFPIRDKRGRVMGFGGRSLKYSNPKYLNSPTTNIFNKGHQLYGLYELQKKCPRPFKVLVVEGYMDVISLVQNGIYYTVSSLGTSTSIDHIQLLFRNTDNVIYCYDGDNAGRQAAWKVLNKSLTYMLDGRQISFMFLPEGEDPDSLIRKEGKILFEKRILCALSLSEFMFKTFLKQVDISSPEGKAKLLTLIRPLIDKIPSQIIRLSIRYRLFQKLGLLDYRILKLLSLQRGPVMPYPRELYVKKKEVK